MTITLKSVLKDTVVSFLKQSIFPDSSYPEENILHRYRVFTYRITLAIVSDKEAATQSYKQTGFDWIVFQNHGKVPEGADIAGGNASLGKIQNFLNAVNDMSTNQPERKYDFFLDELTVKSYMSGVKDWATELRLKILEPYGMDTFLKNILTGLGEKGYRDFSRSCNFVLKIDFIGYPDNSEDPEIVPFSTRYYPLCITDLDANLSAQGTVYEIKAVPMNDTARFEDVNLVPKVVGVSGNTVEEVMNSLQLALNSWAQKMEEESGMQYNRYKIVFVNESGREVKRTKIGMFPMFDPSTDTGPRDTLKAKTSYVTPVKVAELNSQGQAEEPKIVLSIDAKAGLLNIIDNIICDSEYVVTNIREEFANGKDKDGNIAWWRVIPSIKNLKWDAARNNYSKEVTYKIAPRSVHYSKLTSLVKPDVISPASDFEKTTARKYEWQYTGNNKDILNFSINYNQLWTKIISANYGRQVGNPGFEKTSTTDTEVAKAPTTGKPIPAEEEKKKPPATMSGNTVSIKTDSDVSKQANQIKSGSNSNPTLALARDINALMNNPYESIECNFEILGDPLWLGTQFIDNSNTATAGKSNLFTTDGGMAIRTVDPVVRILAYAPTDFDRNGLLGGDGSDREHSMYSAYYTIREVESSFQGGMFKQRLKGNRNVGQDLSNLAKADAAAGETSRFSQTKIDLSVRK